MPSNLQQQLDKGVVREALCKLELENHQRVVRLLLRACALTTITSHQRVQAAVEIKQRRATIARLKTVIQGVQSRRSYIKTRLLPCP